MIELSDLDDRIRDECGVIGIYTPGIEVSTTAFFALFALQHRGQESAGLGVSNGEKVEMFKNVGLVNQVFNEEKLLSLKGSMAVGHTRYSTTGSSELRNAGPIECPSVVGQIVVAHNGNLINADTLKDEMRAEGVTFESDSDSEVLAWMLVRNFPLGPEAAVREVMKRCQGAYSVTVLTKDMILGFRDPSGIRPLTAGTLGDGFMIASETCAFGTVGAVPDRELRPGEMVKITAEGREFTQVVEPNEEAMCLFEYIYFARPDSVMQGRTLYTVRERMGAKLHEEHPVEADIIVPVPDSGVPAAFGYSEASGIPYREGFVKSRYIHRTFINPDDRMREMGVRMKLTPIKEHIEGKRVILVDDSIVRGKTMGQIVKLLLAAGAVSVHVRISAPPIKHPCFYGIDIGSTGELSAAKNTIEEMRAEMGATTLGFISLEGAQRAVNGEEKGFCTACFTGKYPITLPEGLEARAKLLKQKIGEIDAIQTNQPPLLEE